MYSVCTNENTAYVQFGRCGAVQSLSEHTRRFVAQQCSLWTGWVLSCKLYQGRCMCHVTVSVAVAGSVHHHKICGTVLSSVRTWTYAMTTVTWSPVAACSRLSQRRQGTHGRQWSCATTVQHATPVTMPSTDAGVRRCRRPVEAHWRGNVALYRWNNNEPERRGRSQSALGRTDWYYYLSLKVRPDVISPFLCTKKNKRKHARKRIHSKHIIYA